MDGIRSTASGLATEEANGEFCTLAANKAHILADAVIIMMDTLESIKKSSCCNICECQACKAKEVIEKVKELQ